MSDERRVVDVFLDGDSELYVFPFTGEMLIKDRRTSLVLHVASMSGAVELFRAAKTLMDEVLLIYDEEAKRCVERGSQECGEKYYGEDGEIRDKQGMKRCIAEMNRRCLEEAYRRRGLR